MAKQSQFKSIQHEVEALHDMSRDELLERWDKLYDSPAYKGVRNITLIRGIAYKLQEKRQGGLRPSTRRQIVKIARASVSARADQVASPSLTNKRPKVQTGSKLVREWNGSTYEVIVADKGYVLNGVTHASLSACAKAITGAHWSGPRFFGATS
jgi:hypothetical protein